MMLLMTMMTLNTDCERHTSNSLALTSLRSEARLMTAMVRAWCEPLSVLRYMPAHLLTSRTYLPNSLCMSASLVHPRSTLRLFSSTVLSLSVSLSHTHTSSLCYSLPPQVQQTYIHTYIRTHVADSNLQSKLTCVRIPVYVLATSFLLLLLLVLTTAVLSCFPHARTLHPCVYFAKLFQFSECVEVEYENHYEFND